MTSDVAPLIVGLAQAAAANAANRTDETEATCQLLGLLLFASP
jgi:hypothetical protein